VEVEDLQIDDSPVRRFGRDLTSGSIPRHLLAFALPMLAGSALQTAYSFINAVWVGKFLSENALAAITVSMPIFFMNTALAGGLTLAANVLTAQCAGAQDWKRLRSVVQNSFILITAISLALTVIGLALAGPLLKTMNTPPEILPAATSYLRIFLWTLPFSFSIFLIGSLLRGIGDSKTPLYFQAVSLVLNAVLDPLLMFGLLGLPRLGLNGTAVASLIAQCVAVIALWIYAAHRRPVVMPDLRQLRLEAATARQLIVVGLPSAAQQSVVSFSMFFLVTFVSAFGASADAAFGAGLRIDAVAFLPALTIGMAVSSLAGQNIGARQYDRVKEVFKWGALLSGGISLFIGLVVFAAPAVFLKAFINNQKVLDLGVGYLRIVSFTYVIFAIMFVANGIINGAGQTIQTTLFAMITLLGMRIPLSYYLPKLLGNVTGIWYAMLISVSAGMTISLIYYGSGKWKKPLVKKRE